MIVNNLLPCCNICMDVEISVDAVSDFQPMVMIRCIHDNVCKKYWEYGVECDNTVGRREKDES